MNKHIICLPCAIILALASTCALAPAEDLTVKLNGEQTVSSRHDPNLKVFQCENKSDGLHWEFQGAPGTSNYMEVTIPCQWTVPSDGQIEVTVQAPDGPLKRYFSIALITADGMKYSGVMGDSKIGFQFTPAPSRAPILLADLKDKDGKPIAAGTAVDKISLVMTSIAEDSPKTVIISNLHLVTDGSSK